MSSNLLQDAASAVASLMVIPPEPPIPIPEDPWVDAPSSCAEECQLSALECIEDWYGGDRNVPTELEHMIDQAVLYVRYIDFMSKFWNVMGILRSIFSIVLLYY